MTDPFAGPAKDARADWRLLATEVAEGAEPPPACLIQALAEAAGGLPAGVTATESFRATTRLIESLKGE